MTNLEIYRFDRNVCIGAVLGVCVPHPITQRTLILQKTKFCRIDACRLTEEGGEGRDTIDHSPGEGEATGAPSNTQIQRDSVYALLGRHITRVPRWLLLRLLLMLLFSLRY